MNRISLRIGFWASIIVAVLGAIYVLLLAGYFTVEGFSFPPTPFVQTVGGIVTILSAPAILIVFAALWHLASEEKAVYATIALTFTIPFVAMVSINRFVQLTIVRLSPAGPQSADLAWF